MVLIHDEGTHTVWCYVAKDGASIDVWLVRFPSRCRTGSADVEECPQAHVQSVLLQCACSLLSECDFIASASQLYLGQV